VKFHHIGIFVDSIETGIDEMSKIYEIEHIGKTIEDSLIGVNIVFLKDSSGINYELVAPFGDDSPVTGVLVASRMIVRPFYKQMRMRSVPVFHRPHWRFAFECRLGQLMVVQGHVTHERLLQIFTAGESVCFEHICNATVEPLDHAVRFGRARFGQAMLNAQSRAQLIKLMVARGLSLTACKQPVSELLAVVGQDFLHSDRAGLVQGVQERASGGRCLVTLDLHKHPARSPVNGHKQVAPAGFIGHLGQVFDIDVDEPRLVAFEGFVWLSGFFGLERVEVANAVAAQAAIQPRAGGLVTNEFTSDRQQVIQGQQQHLAQFHDDGLLRLCQRRLKPVRCVRGIGKDFPVLPLARRILADRIARSQLGHRIWARRHLCPDGWGGACVLVQSNHHDKAPGWSVEWVPRLSISCRMTSLAMNNGYLLGSMQSSGMRQVLKRGHGFLNHLAYTTEQFDNQLRNLRNLGMIPLGPAKKAVAFNGRRVVFLLTKLHYIIEIIEEPVL